MCPFSQFHFMSRYALSVEFNSNFYVFFRLFVVFHIILPTFENAKRPYKPEYHNPDHRTENNKKNVVEQKKKEKEKPTSSNLYQHRRHMNS